MSDDAYLLLEDGTRLDGDAVGAEREVTGYDGRAMTRCHAAVTAKARSR